MDKYKALFIHIPKTGGASMSAAPFILKYGSFSVAPDTDFNKSMVRFSFVRNPYERYASAVLNLDYATEETFKEFTDNITLEKILEDDHYIHLRPMYWYLHTDKGDCVDFIGRFENLRKDWQKLCKMVGEYHPLPHHNSSGRSYDELLTPYVKDKIYLMYYKDFKEFGYGEK